MSYTLQFKRYSTITLGSITGANGELILDTTKKTLTVHDGTTAGGYPLTTENYVSAQLVSYTLNTNLTSTLASYATNANLTSTLTSYTTNASLTSTLASYVTNANLTSTLTSYTTNTNLTSTLTSYTTNANLTGTLTSYATNANLTSTLTSYATNANLTSTLANYTTNANLTSTLNSYILKTSNLIVANINVTSLATLSSGINVTYQPASTVGAAITISGKGTQGGTDYIDFVKITNNAAGTTNSSKTIRLGNTGSIEVINHAYTTAIATLTDGGNLSVYGSVSPSAWTAGQVIKDTMLDNSQVTVVSTTIATSGSNVDFITYDYTPVSASSYLIVHIHISKYVPAGTVDDSWYSVLKVAGNEIAYGWQKVNDDANGTSGRSGVLFPLMGRYTNASTATKTIAVAARRDTADDSIVIDNSATAIWLRITEVAR